MVELGMQVAEEIMGVGLRRKLRDVLEGVDTFFGFAGVFVNEAEVVPGVRVFGQEASRFFQRDTRFLELLLACQGDAGVYARTREFGVGGEGVLSRVLRF